MNPAFLRFLCIRAFYRGLSKSDNGEMDITYVVQPVYWEAQMYGYQEIWSDETDWPS